MFKTYKQSGFIPGIVRVCLVSLAMVFLAVACAPKELREPSTGHIGMEPEQAAEPVGIPQPVTRAPALPAPAVQEPLETYTVIVNEVPAKELLFALARDAKMNLDIYDDIEGTVTINAIDQTMPQILDRIARQSNIRYQMDGDNLAISADTPYLRTYKVPYVNMSRSSTGQIDSSTQIAASGTVGVGDNARGGGGNRSNNSTMSVTNNSEYDFWRTIFINLNSIVGEGKTAASSGKELTNSNIVINRESGLISVRANSKQHADVQAFIDQVLTSVQRQVLIEATVVEVTLSDGYQAGVDWAAIDNGSGVFDSTLSAEQAVLGNNLATPPTFLLNYTDPDSNGRQLSAAVRLLSQYGDVKVLSSPKIMAMNNQTSILKVVDNRVYFTIDVDISQNQTQSLTTYETNIHTVPVGLVLSLVPSISDSEEVILNIRPTISRILRFVNDPNPVLKDADVQSPIPEIQVREMESVLRLNNGQIAVIGGLMQDSISKTTDGVPGLSRVPGLGEAFKYRDNQTQKNELVIFLRTTVIKEPSLDGDLKQFREFLPAHQSGKS
ncbi:MAG: pilus (MSHA type) biogenesis protein MshL [Gammaproteobacteria bacterium]|nr:pilus (MSHA type) biogenesis protein MshL [Gammaproteobacteria bacterium]